MRQLRSYEGMTTADMFWLAGFLEGEGSFCAGVPSNPRAPIVQAVSTDEDVIQRVAAIFGVKYHRATRRKAKPHHKMAYRTAIRGYKAVCLMDSIRHLMGCRRQGQIDAALACYDRTSMRKVTEDDVVVMLHLVDMGIKQAEIGIRLGFSRETVNKTLRAKQKLGLMPR